METKERGGKVKKEKGQEKGKGKEKGNGREGIKAGVGVGIRAGIGRSKQTIISIMLGKK